MKQISAIDAYMAKVYRWIMILAMLSVSSASFDFLLMKGIFGYYDDVGWVPIIIFTLSNVIYDAIGTYMVRHAIKDGIVQPKMMRAGKIYMTTMLIIQFNFILYLIPSREFWAFMFYFILLAAFLLDYKMIGFLIGVLSVSILIGFIVRRDTILPIMDKNTFFPELAIRFFTILLSLVGIYLFTRFAGKHLVDAKRDELEKNNNRTNQVLGKAKNISDRLSKTSEMVLENVESESASTEELSSISEELLEMSRNIIEHNNESTNNLHLLKECSANVSDKVRKSREISDDLVGISKESEKHLNDLLKVSDEVVTSNGDTMEAVQRLLEGTQKIGSTVNIIDEIATSTNLLALNAAIEAARAGEAGKGFAVVANEIGNLARNTQSSLKEINDVVEALKAEATVVTESIGLSSEKLNYQTETLERTVVKIKKMMNLLSSSLGAIREVDDLNEEQVSLIATTFTYNENISRQIEVENEQFTNIVGVVQNITVEITELNNQVDGLNEIVKELESLLKN